MEKFCLIFIGKWLLKKHRTQGLGALLSHQSLFHTKRPKACVISCVMSCVISCVMSGSSLTVSVPVAIPWMKDPCVICSMCHAPHRPMCSARLPDVLSEMAFILQSAHNPPAQNMRPGQRIACCLLHTSEYFLISCTL